MSVVVLISGNGSNLQALIDAGIPIDAVISNRANAFGLTRAEKSGIPTHVISHKDFVDREAFDDVLATQVETYQPKLVVLAGFMRVLSGKFIRTFSGRLINIHPSLLPKYKGLHTHRRALEAGDEKHGISIHYVNNDLDGGPVIAQSELNILPNDTESNLTKRIQLLEHKLYPHICQLILSGQIELSEDRVFFDGKPLAVNGIMLNL